MERMAQQFQQQRFEALGQSLLDQSAHIRVHGRIQQHDRRDRVDPG
jgi:hypothetical protein